MLEPTSSVVGTAKRSAWLGERKRWRVRRGKRTEGKGERGKREREREEGGNKREREEEVEEVD